MLLPPCMEVQIQIKWCICWTAKGVDGVVFRLSPQLQAHTSSLQLRCGACFATKVRRSICQQGTEVDSTLRRGERNSFLTSHFSTKIISDMFFTLAVGSTLQILSSLSWRQSPPVLQRSKPWLTSTCSSAIWGQTVTSETLHYRTNHTAPTSNTSDTHLCRPLIFLWALDNPQWVRAGQPSQWPGRPSQTPLWGTSWSVSPPLTLGHKTPGFTDLNPSLHIPRPRNSFILQVFFSAILTVLVLFQFSDIQLASLYIILSLLKYLTWCFLDWVLTDRHRF